eukprot:CAMPEP_0119374834 /NCGR_PEP_ID=MMETSP1334-20130426/33365_1 /TAXON_ID=127549 /ORGANISM="Calcidiscus leptoporus, Strain RCC1130" /LENGTH=195 /DNA_ID=CAMNT_0007393011 /DNA_START=480 /DNA_END=1066 /DNA_ORIENTATION=+
MPPGLSAAAFAAIAYIAAGCAAWQAEHGTVLATSVLRVVAEALVAKEGEVLLHEARHRGDGHLDLHGLGVAQLAVVRVAARVVVANCAAVAEALTACVADHRSDLRTGTLQRCHLFAHKLMLHMPEAASAKVQLDRVLCCDQLRAADKGGQCRRSREPECFATAFVGPVGGGRVQRQRAGCRHEQQHASPQSHEG